MELFVRVALATELSTSGAIFALDNVPVRNSIAALYIVDLRASLLYADDMVDRIALDRYSFIRDGFLQRRRYLIYDGNPPRELDPEDDDDDEPPPAASPAGAAPAPAR